MYWTIGRKKSIVSDLKKIYYLIKTNYYFKILKQPEMNAKTQSV